jgi:hypothetical protein
VLTLPPPDGVLNPPVPFKYWAAFPLPTISALTLEPDACQVTLIPFAPAVGVVALKFGEETAEPFTLTDPPPPQPVQDDTVIAGLPLRPPDVPVVFAALLGTSAETSAR